MEQDKAACGAELHNCTFELKTPNTSFWNAKGSQMLLHASDVMTLKLGIIGVNQSSLKHFNFPPSIDRHMGRLCGLNDRPNECECGATM